MAEDIQISYVGDNKDAFLDIKFFKAITPDGNEYDSIRIVIPGNSATVIEEAVTDYYKARYPVQWMAYQMQQDQTGTRIADWNGIPDTVQREFLRNDFTFVEQIAAAPDISLSRIPGGLTWRMQAQAYLKRNEKSAESIIAEQQAKIADQQAQIDAMKQEMAEFMASMQAQITRPRGRPPAEAAA